MARLSAAFAGWFVRMARLSFSLVPARSFVKRQLPMWLALAVSLGGVPAGGAPGAPAYRILVSSESGDIVSQLTWDGAALKTVKVVPVGIMPADIDGPHNVTVSPDGRYWYVTIAHGTPYGTLWKMAVDGDTLVGKAPVEMFPTTISLTPDGGLAFVANSDFHVDHPRMNVVSIVCTPELVETISTGHGAYNVEPSPDGRWVIATNKKAQSVSLIDAATLTEVARIPTAKPFPHGVAYAPDGRYAFVSQESKGVDPGAVNVIDLQTKTSVASIAVPLQPTGITILARP